MGGHKRKTTVTPDVVAMFSKLVLFTVNELRTQCCHTDVVFLPLFDALFEFRQVVLTMSACSIRLELLPCDWQVEKRVENLAESLSSQYV